MFTGIVHGVGQISSVTHSPMFTRYTLTLPAFLLNNLSIGASISVDGVCQTVVEIIGNTVTFEAIDETLKRTTIATFCVGQLVNVERAAKMGDEIGGHLVGGHIIGTARICDITSLSAEQKVINLSCDPIWMKYIFPKGFIALNGVSLTVGKVDPNGQFTVHLIPETLRATTFGALKTGDKVNVEIDHQTQIMVDTVERLVAAKKD